jgi:hypothetical protein
MPRKGHAAATPGCPADASANENRLRALCCIEETGQRGDDLVCLPEGYIDCGNEACPERIPRETYDALGGACAPIRYPGSCEPICFEAVQR